MSTDEQALTDEWEEEVEAQPPDKCPACGGSRFGIYVMGLPMTGGDFFEQLDRDEIRLLGCIPSDNDPFWFCRDCDADILEEGWLAPNEEVARELERLNELLYDDALDYDEFQAARKRLLSRALSQICPTVG